MKASRLGRFEQSFMFHMIRDFFLLLLAVTAIELAIRYAALLYEFRQNEPARVDRAAAQLAPRLETDAGLTPDPRPWPPDDWDLAVQAPSAAGATVRIDASGQNLKAR